MHVSLRQGNDIVKTFPNILLNPRAQNVCSESFKALDFENVVNCGGCRKCHPLPKVIHFSYMNFG